MIKLILNLLIQTAAVLICAYLIPGIYLQGYFQAFVVAVVFGILNTFLKPLISAITTPLTILTFGLFGLVINVGIVYLTVYLVPGFTVNGFITALLFSFGVYVVSLFLGLLSK